jgi:putative ABC transport system substrate-binding protein
MKRREFITLLGGAATFIPPSAWAQQSQLPLIGVLNAASAKSTASSYEAFRSALRQLGYIEGRNIRIEYRYADGFLDRLQALAEEVVRLNPSVIVSGPLPANLAVRKATATIPIVMATGADPVGFGLVQSLSRPGGNVTGLANFAEELASKQLDVIRELLPRLARVAALVNVENPLHVPQLREMRAAAAKASLALVHFEYRVPEDLERDAGRVIE